MIRRCNTCGELKDLEKFKKDKRDKDGYSNICKKCHTRQYNKYYMRKERDSIKRDVKCIVCGKEFVTWWKHKTTCSKFCSKKNILQKAKEGRMRKHPEEKRICRVCGKDFFTRKIHGVKSQRVCSKKCNKKMGNKTINRGGRIYFPLISKFDIVDRKVRLGLIEHHINKFCVIPIPIIPHINTRGTLQQHREEMKKWMLLLYVTDFDEMINNCL